MYEDISDYTDEERRAVYFYELFKERAETGTISPLDQIDFEWAEQVLARRRARTAIPVTMVGYGYFTPVPGYVGLQLKLMGQICGIFALLAAFIYAFFIL